MICGFTGYRPQKLFGYDINSKQYNHIREKIKKSLFELKAEKIISGMALGIDTIAAEISIELTIHFIAAVPFIGQELAWPEASRTHYHILMSKAAETVIVSEGGYATWKMQKRNQYIVDNCDILIAICHENNNNGGTYNCVQYAKSIQKNVVIINPFVEQ